MGTEVRQMRDPGMMTNRALELVEIGMTVVDAGGKEIGPVEYFELGQGDEVPDDSLPDVFRAGAAAASDRAGEPQLPEPVRTQFRRYGFLKVDGPGLTDTDRYVRGDWVAGVTGDRVTLTLPWDALPREV
jgi:hypothetical protein